MEQPHVSIAIKQRFSPNQTVASPPVLAASYMAVKTTAKRWGFGTPQRKHISPTLAPSPSSVCSASAIDEA
ncbi:hypothetical protein B296_00046194 [Ensete ventricosum]|uniref:Uncharacterized protein n=1 Tax=Ensete ventricosum TaxID=4639 RepID=A0A426Z026_ENSVE|nr:hypothetical protein B296_00046194 [Ensete ventricosum]